MSEFPLGYERVPPTTWAYLSSLLMIALYFKFTRFWSVRNLDLCLILLLASGLLTVHSGASSRQSVFDDMAAAREAGKWAPEQYLEGLDQATRLDDENASDVTENDLNASDRRLETGTEDTPGSGAESDLSGGTEGDLEVHRALLITWQARYDESRRLELTGYLILFSIGGLLLIRMLLDPIMVRRPLLEPNLSSGGLTFMGVAMLVFLFTNIWASVSVTEDLFAVRENTDDEAWWELENKASVVLSSPGYLPLYRAPILPTFVDGDRSEHLTSGNVGLSSERITKGLIVLCLVAIAVGIVMIGYLHFENFWMGIGVATMFLMLPYTVQMMGRLPHVLPAALLVWAVVLYRMPFLSGVMLGICTGMIYYPLFLLPVWLGFYWKRGLSRFLMGCILAVSLLVVALAYTSASGEEFWLNFQAMFGLWWPKYGGLQGIWSAGWEPVFRLPFIAGSIALSVALVVWPTRKNLGALLSGSCAIMLAIQFWHGHGGGLVMAWYLPLALLAIFRPNLEDYTAVNKVRETRWLSRS